MPRRHRPEPDTRLDWRDPDMPVLRKWEEPWGAVVLKEISPEEESAHCREVMLYGTQSGSSDYNLAAETKRKRRARIERLMKNDRSGGIGK